jgi:tRNA (Thr-GGU) A37 N-methylase
VTVSDFTFRPEVPPVRLKRIFFFYRGDELYALDLRQMRATAAAVLVVALAVALVPNARAAHATTDVATSANNGGEAFLAGKYVEVGVRANGAFGSSSSNVPSGFHPQSGGLGFVAIRDKAQTSWSAARAANLLDGDFFVPGTPYEGWGIKVGSNTHANNNHSVTGIAGTLGSVTNATVDGANNTVTWTATTDHHGIGISKTYSVPQDGQSLNIVTTLTNNSGSTISSLYYGRGVDPDNQRDADTYNSTNRIVAQYSGATPYSLVRAEFSQGAQISLFSEDPRAKVARQGGGFDQTFSPKSVWDGSGFTTAVEASGLRADAGMNLAFKVENLAAGASTTLSYSYLLTEDAAEEAVAAASAPVAPSATPGDSEVALEWSQPASGSSIIGYRLRYTTDNGANYTTVPTDFQGDSAPREFTVTGLTNGTEYKSQVVALTGTDTLTSGVYSSATVGTYSNSSVGVIPGAPTAPSLSSVTAGNQRLTVAFLAPAHTGGFAITDYEYSIDDGSTWVAAGTTSSPFVISGLGNGTPYEVKFRGKNASRSGVASSATAGTPVATVADAPTISSVAATSQTLTIAFAAPANNGGSAITNYKYSTDGTNYRALSPTQTSSPIVIQYLSTDGTTALTNGTANPITLKAVNTPGDSVASNSVTATPGVPAPASSGGGGTTAAPPSTATLPPLATRILPRPLATPTLQQGPVLRGNVPPAPPSAPTATIGGRSTSIQSQVTSPTGFSLTAGVLNLGLQVQQDQGVVRQNGTGGTEVEVRKGSTTALTGSGLLPRSTVQVFLPLQGTNAMEVARIPVDETGAFSGDAVFATRVNERPMPIGRQVMQIVSLDENGQQSVVEMTINIAQGSPAPESDRTVGEVPTLTPGQSVATNAGEPEVVRVTADSAVKSATVEGDGWTMSVNIEGASGEVSQSGEGGALLQFVRDEGILVAGGGFMPGTRADVWLFSEPTLLGTVDIDENGEFSGTVMVDGNVVPVGDHTLQLQGVGEDGFVRAANLGVTVSDAVAEVTTEEAAGGLLWWLWVLLILLALLMWFALWRYRRTREASGR